MKNKKKFLIPSFVFLFVVFIIILITIQNKNRTTAPSITTSPIPTIKIVKEYDQNFPINITVGENSLNIPQKTMVYKIESSQYTDTKIKEIAGSLGFETSSYRKSNDQILGDTISFSSNNAYLRIVPSLNIIDYKKNLGFEGITKDNINDSYYIDTATKFIKDKKLVANDDQLVINTTRHMYIDEWGHVKDTKNTNAISVSFTKKIGEYEVVSPSYETGVVRVVFNTKNEIVFVYVDDTPKFTDFLEYNLKNLNEIKKGVQELSALKSINNGKISPLEISKDSISSAQIDSIKLAYLQELDVKQKYLQPVFVLEGSLSFKDGGVVVGTFLMPALSDSPVVN